MPAKKYSYDVEVFPNFFSATFLDCSKKEEKHVFTIFEGTNDAEALVKFLSRKMTLIGFNNIMYDGAVINFIIKNVDAEDINTKLFSMSKKLVSEEFRFDPELSYYRHKFPVKYQQIDLMKIMAFDKLGVSLKQVAVNLKWHRIQDLPLPFDHNVTFNEVEKILDYNLNDVLITKKLYDSIQPEINLRIDLGNMFDVDIINASDSKIANVLLEKIYSTESGMSVDSLRDMRTKHSSIPLRECFGKGIGFSTVGLKNLKDDITKLTVNVSDNFKYSKTVCFDGTYYELGVGGLHSKDKSEKFKTSDEYIIRDADVASYYPNILLNNGIRPSHLGEDFLRILGKITKERLQAKRSGDKVKANGLKITINSIFGKLGSDTFWLEDAKALLTVTISGQFYLLMLIEALALEGIKTISANTDGIVCKIPTRLEDTYYKICSEWEKKTEFELEFTDYEYYVRADVNNYITKKPDGAVKEKGRFSRSISLKKGYSHPIIPQCLYEYFINGVAVEDTLRNSTDILDYCISKKSGGKFKMEYHCNGEIDTLQKTNRFYISNSGGSLIKRNMETGSETGLYVGNLVKILNDYDETVEFDAYDVNVSFYISEAKKIIEEIDKPYLQSNLFVFDQSVSKELVECKNDLNVEALTPCEGNGAKVGVTSSRLTSSVTNNNYVSENVSTSTEVLSNQHTHSESEDYFDYYIYLEDKIRIQYCPTCGSSNTMSTEDWCYCSDCSNSWSIDKN